MRQTEISKKITYFNYFISALGNLKKGTNTNKLLLQIWTLSSILLYSIIFISLSFIGHFEADNLFIKIIVYLSLFGFSSILPFFIFSIVYYMSFVFEFLNKMFNFIYLMIIGEISFKKWVSFLLLKIKREFRLSGKEIKTYIENKDFFPFNIMMYMNIVFLYIFAFKKNDNLKHTFNSLNILFVGAIAILSVVLYSILTLEYSTLLNLEDFNLLLTAIVLPFISAFVLFGILIVIFSSIYLVFFGLGLVYLVITGFVPFILFVIKKIKEFLWFVISLPLIVARKVVAFFEDMQKNYEGSKVEIHNYIEEKMEEKK